MFEMIYKIDTDTKELSANRLATYTRFVEGATSFDEAVSVVRGCIVSSLRVESSFTVELVRDAYGERDKVDVEYVCLKLNSLDDVVRVEEMLVSFPFLSVCKELPYPLYLEYYENKLQGVKAMLYGFSDIAKVVGDHPHDRVDFLTYLIETHSISEEDLSRFHKEFSLGDDLSGWVVLTEHGYSTLVGVDRDIELFDCHGKSYQLLPAVELILDDEAICKFVGGVLKNLC